MHEVKVAVLNTSKEITDILLEIFIASGFTACAAYTTEFKGQEKKFDEFIEINKPSIIVYDIALPYEENYALFKRLSDRESVRKLPIILTTTNKHALETLVGKTSTYELIGKPYDLEQIINAVKKSVKHEY